MNKLNKAFILVIEVLLKKILIIQNYSVKFQNLKSYLAVPF